MAILTWSEMLLYYKNLIDDMKKTFLKTALLLVAALMLTTACGDDENEVKRPSEPDPEVAPGSTHQGDKSPGMILLSADEQQLLNRINAFGFSLLQSAASQTRGNMVVSPLGTAMMLGMMADAAATDTRNEILRVMGAADFPAEVVNGLFQTILRANADLDTYMKANFVNALYGNSGGGASLHEGYVNDLDECYSAPTEWLDFASDEASRHINQTFADKTDGLLTQLVAPGTLSPQALTFMANATAADVVWYHLLEADNTQPRTFTDRDGQPLTMDIMWQPDSVPNMADATLQAVDLLLGHSGSLHMVLVMPSDKAANQDIDHLLTLLTPERWQKLLRDCKTTKLSIALPRFSLTSQWSLAEMLQPMGLTQALTTTGQYLGISAPSPRTLPLITTALQTTAVNVGEHGVNQPYNVVDYPVTSSGSLPQATDKLPTFHAVRPFLFFIYEQSSGAIFLAGRFCGR